MSCVEKAGQGRAEIQGESSLCADEYIWSVSRVSEARKRNGGTYT